MINQFRQRFRNMTGTRMRGLFGSIILFGLCLHILLSLTRLAGEVGLALQELPLLWGKTNDQRQVILLGGLVDSIEDHEFIAACEREIPINAEVLVKTNSLANVYILNYYLYPRKTAVDKEALGKKQWTVSYFTPKALGMNDIEKPKGNGKSD